jgi:hypothetical protein
MAPPFVEVPPPMGICAGANGKLGGVQSDALDGVQPDSGDSNGKSLHPMRSSFALGARGTPGERAGGKSQTREDFTGGPSQTARNGILDGWPCEGSTAKVTWDFDLGRARIDHAALLLSMTAMCVRKVSAKRSVICDRAAPARPKRQVRRNSALALAPPVRRQAPLEWRYQAAIGCAWWALETTSSRKRAAILP